MASARYTLNIKPEDLIPDEPLPQTRKQKIQNWLHYHKWWFIGGALVLLILGMIVRDMVTAPEYDYTIGIVTSQMLPDQILDELSDAFATLADDRDGNGEVAVQVQQYNLQFTEETGESGDSSSAAGSSDPAASGYEDTSGVQAAGNLTNAYERIAAMTRLTGDLSSATSFIYLTDDPAGLQNNALLFCYTDGTTPAEGATDVENMTVAWADTPAADLGRTLPVTMGGNAYLNGAKPWTHEGDARVLPDANAVLRLVEKDGHFWLENDLEQYSSDLRAEPVTKPLERVSTTVGR